MYLYLITIKNAKSFYIIADDPTSAYTKLLKCLEKEDLYFITDRQLRSIEVIGSTFYEKNMFEKEN